MAHLMSERSSHIEVCHGSIWQCGVPDHHSVEFGLAEVVRWHRTRAERRGCVVEATYFSMSSVRAMITER
jgi:hypothetical protein